MTIDNTISFRADMIDLILSGRKTVTIRPIKSQLDIFFLGFVPRMSIYYTWNDDHQLRDSRWIAEHYPHGKVGDIVTVRERPDIKLKITSIWFDWVMNLVPDVWHYDGLSDSSEESIISHWESFYSNTKYQWYYLPWVWVIEFELVEGGKA